MIPMGDNSERPSTGSYQGSLGVNAEENLRFEGYNLLGWVSLMNVSDSTGSTKITAKRRTS